MSLTPPVARALYRALLRASSQLDVELSRCESLRTRELDNLRSVTAGQLPRDIRGLLDITPLTFSSSSSPSSSTLPTSASTSPSPSTSTVSATSTATATATATTSLPDYVRRSARRVVEAAHAPGLQGLGLDARVGFTALRHISHRVDALRHLVYDTTSNAERFGIRVGVHSEFQGADRHRYLFRYRVHILNQSHDTVKLISRQWTIRDLDGRVISVQGPGVVGAFPTLGPNQSYEYSSAVPLHTPVGTQSGHYMFVTLLEEHEENQQQQEMYAFENQQQQALGPQSSLSSGQKEISKMLQVPVAPFSHRTPSIDLHLQQEKEKGNASATSTKENSEASTSSGQTSSSRRR